MMKRYSLRTGFSLVEMSITLLIIALALASIIGGAHLLEVANINRVAGKLSFFKQSVTDFREKYSSYPGDMPNADEFWSDVSPGNGNNRIDDNVNPVCTTECLGAWQHLGKANMVNSAFTGVASAVTPSGYEINVNVPDSNIKAAFYFVEYAELYGTKGNIVQLSGNEDSGPDEGMIRPETARNLDKKYDDSNPAEGGFISARSDSQKTDDGICVNGDYSVDTVADYVLADTTPSCRIMVRINAE